MEELITANIFFYLLTIFFVYSLLFIPAREVSVIALLVLFGVLVANQGLSLFLLTLLFILIIILGKYILKAPRGVIYSFSFFLLMVGLVCYVVRLKAASEMLLSSFFITLAISVAKELINDKKMD